MYTKRSLVQGCCLLAALQCAQSFYVGNGIVRSEFQGRTQAAGGLQLRQRSVDALFNTGKRPQQSRRSLLTCRVAAPKRYASGDWFENLQNLPHSKLLREITPHLAANTAWAAFISLLHELTPQHIIDSVHISTVPHAIMASALGLLLVFRNNASYDRFWEARKIWGSTVNTVRNIGRLAYASMGQDEVHHKQFMEYLKAFPWLMMQHLRDERNDEEVAWIKVSPEEFELIQSNPNPPLFVCERMSQIIDASFGNSNVGNYLMPDGNPMINGVNGSGVNGVNGSSTYGNQKTAFYRFQLEQGVNLLIDYLGMCERVLTTPVPRSYSRHTSRLLSVYLATVPIVLVPNLEYWTAPVVCAMGWGLLSIEAIAYYIEQPFDKEKNQLPLINYATKMKSDLERLTTPAPLPQSVFAMDADFDENEIPPAPPAPPAPRAPVAQVQAAAPKQPEPVAVAAAVSEPVSAAPAAPAAPARPAAPPTSEKLPKYSTM